MKKRSCGPELGYPDNDKNKPTGPLANQHISGTFGLDDMLSDESLAALYRAKLNVEKR